MCKETEMKYTERDFTLELKRATRRVFSRSIKHGFYKTLQKCNFIKIRKDIEFIYNYLF